MRQDTIHDFLIMFIFQTKIIKVNEATSVCMYFFCDFLAFSLYPKVIKNKAQFSFVLIFIFKGMACLISHDVTHFIYEYAYNVFASTRKGKKYDGQKQPNIISIIIREN